MGQLSFFSADLLPPRLADLGGLLAAHGQITTSGGGARLSILLIEPARATALVAECAARDVVATADPVEGSPGLLLRTERSTALVRMAAQWTRGAVKGVPDALAITPGFLRCWALASGISDGTGYLLGLDPHAPDTLDELEAACARAGIAGSYLGARGGGPAIRIVSHRRLTRLIDTIGTLPAGLPRQAYPYDPVARRTAPMS